ncbi:hypothetical protein FA95DRAFT_1606052 [Auriscalpium vulgare]|uniref:Uncharacterized protein n=1 Tax=Auriscalpium vulgare TaxID=40419 RepID=A0ACB8RUC6_9AGAM|nr:hypothetical protein FA95DRAFT_1606052 [Auriscalpium vulgare]
MSLSRHPNVLRIRGGWVEDHKLYIALRLMDTGSACRCRVKSPPRAYSVSYLHVNGFIPRYNKAANLLIDDDGTGFLATWVSPPHCRMRTTRTQSQSPRVARACHCVRSRRRGRTQRTRIGMRRSFVGTPCWMASELSGKHHQRGHPVVRHHTQQGASCARGRLSRQLLLQCSKRVNKQRNKEALEALEDESLPARFAGDDPSPKRTPTCAPPSTPAAQCGTLSLLAKIKSSAGQVGAGAHTRIAICASFIGTMLQRTKTLTVNGAAP